MRASGSMRVTRERVFGYGAVAAVAAAMALAVVVGVRRGAPPQPAAAPPEVAGEALAPIAPVPADHTPRAPEPAPLPAFVEVRDAATDAPLAGAVVELLDRGGRTASAHTTDASGRVHFPGGVPPPGGVLCRHPGHRVAGRFDLLADHVLRLQPERTMLVELARVPAWLDPWTLEAELRYPRRIAAAREIGNHLASARVPGCAARASIEVHRAALPVRIESTCEVAILATPPDEGPAEQLACVPLRAPRERVVVDLGDVRERGKVWTLRGIVELPNGCSLRGMRAFPIAKRGGQDQHGAGVAGAIDSPTTFTSSLLEEGLYRIDVDVASGTGEPWRVVLGMEDVASDATRRWSVDLRPQVRVTVLGQDEVIADALRVVSPQYPKHAVRRTAEGKLELAALAPGSYHIAWMKREQWCGEGMSFRIAKDGPVLDVLLDARRRHTVSLKIDAGAPPEGSAAADGVLQVRDLDTGQWLEGLEGRAARYERRRVLTLPPGRHAIRVRYPDKILEASVIVPSADDRRIHLELR
jgi:hypothetical protein